MTQINSAPIRFLEQFEISLFITFRKTWMWNKVGLGFLYVDISSLFLLQDWSWTHVAKGWIGSINGEYIFLFPALVLQLFFNSIPSLINRFVIRWYQFAQFISKFDDTPSSTNFEPRNILFFSTIDKRIFASSNISSFLRNREIEMNVETRSTDFSEIFFHEEGRGGERRSRASPNILSFCFLGCGIFFSRYHRFEKKLDRELDFASSILSFHHDLREEFSNREEMGGVAMSAIKIYVHISLSF